MDHDYPSDVDFTKDAAAHLREQALERGLKIGSGHAHALVAAHLGYKSRPALLAPNSDHCTDDQWLHREEPDTAQIGETISRMRDTGLTDADVPFIADTIRDGLTPPCVETGIRSSRNIPVGDVEPGDETEWVHPIAAHDEKKFGHCRCCGHSALYRLENLDDQMLCEEHQGEFDRDPEEQKDWDDLVEYLTKE